MVISPNLRSRPTPLAKTTIVSTVTPGFRSRDSRKATYAGHSSACGLTCWRIARSRAVHFQRQSSPASEARASRDARVHAWSARPARRFRHASLSASVFSRSASASTASAVISGSGGGATGRQRKDANQPPAARTTPASRKRPAPRETEVGSLTAGIPPKRRTRRPLTSGGPVSKGRPAGRSPAANVPANRQARKARPSHSPRRRGPPA